MPRSVILLAGGLASIYVGSLFAQDATLAQKYGQGAHAYFSGEYLKAQEQLTAAVAAGSKDPRVFYFRGLACFKLGHGEEAAKDFQKGAELESRDPYGLYNVSKSLERVQGSARLELEKYRVTARMAATEQIERLRKARYEAVQREEARVLRQEPPPPPEPLEMPSPAAQEPPAPSKSPPATGQKSSPPAKAPAAEDPFAAPEQKPEPKASNPAPAAQEPPVPSKSPPATGQKSSPPAKAPAAEDPFAAPEKKPEPKTSKPAPPAAEPAEKAAEAKPAVKPAPGQPSGVLDAMGRGLGTAIGKAFGKGAKAPDAQGKKAGKPPEKKADGDNPFDR